MTEENKMRLITAAVWLICFVGMRVFFHSSLPKDEFKAELNEIEKNAANKDWNKAKKSMEQLKNIYNSRRIIIQWKLL